MKLTILFVFLLHLSIGSAVDLDLKWKKITPTGAIPTNITGAVFEYDDSGKAYLLLGQREIWPLSGEISITFVNNAYSYDVATHVWQLVSVSGPKPVARAYPAGVYVGTPFDKKIFFYGGSTFNNAFGNVVLFDDFWYFNTITKKYTQITPSSSERPGPRSGAKLFNVGTKLYLFGGISDFIVTPDFALPVYTKELWAFDLITLKWSLIVGAGPSARAEPQRFQRLGKLYINGGEAFNQETFGFDTPNDTWAFNTFSGTWTDVTPSPSKNINPARNYGASFPLVVQSLVPLVAQWAVYGGELDGGQVDGCGAPFPQNPGGDLWIYFPLLDLWQQVTPSGTAPPPLKRALGTQVDSNKSIMISGFNFICPGPGQVYNNAVYELSRD